MTVFSLSSWSWPWSWPRSGPGASNNKNFEVEPVFARSKTGIPITREMLFTCSAINCGVAVLSQGIAQVPLKLFKEENTNKRAMRVPAREHSAYRLLAEQPNDFQTSFTFRETLMTHALIAGNGYAFIDRRKTGPKAGTIRELIPISPDSMNVRWSTQDKRLEYHWNSGKYATEVMSPRDILHIKGPSWDGFSGMSALAIAGEAVGLSVSLERGQAKFATNGQRPSGVLSTKVTTTTDIVKRLKDSWNEKFGPDGEGGVAVADGGWEYQPMTMSAVDSQLIETRRFQIEEVARFLRVFPQMMMQADKTATYASAEQFFLAHVVHSLDPWMERFEQEIKKSIIGYSGENENVYPRFIREGLLRGAAADRADFYQKALGAGGANTSYMSKNEVRERENLNPIDDPVYDLPPEPIPTAKIVPPDAGGANTNA
jgi:HK97 family phage portal protein